MTSSSSSNELQLSKTLKDAEKQLANQGLPADDALLLLEHATNHSKEHLLAHPEQLLTSEAATTFQELLSQRIEGYSVAVLVGTKEFYGRSFTTTKDVLVPRPETESIVEAVLKNARERLRDTAKPRILDLGTGSGCIAVTIASELPEAEVFASDISEAALNVARQNAEKHRVSITFYMSDLLHSIPKMTFDYIVANLPYLPASHMTEPSIQKEPTSALFGGNTEGTDFYVRLFSSCTEHLSSNGVLAIEIDPSQHNVLTKKAHELLPKHTTKTILDLAGKKRGLLISLL